LDKRDGKKTPTQQAMLLGSPRAAAAPDGDEEVCTSVCDVKNERVLLVLLTFTAKGYEQEGHVPQAAFGLRMSFFNISPEVSTSNLLLEKKPHPLKKKHTQTSRKTLITTMIFPRASGNTEQTINSIFRRVDEKPVFTLKVPFPDPATPPEPGAHAPWEVGLGDLRDLFQP